MIIFHRLGNIAENFISLYQNVLSESTTVASRNHQNTAEALP